MTIYLGQPCVSMKNRFENRIILNQIFAVMVNMIVVIVELDSNNNGGVVICAFLLMVIGIIVLFNCCYYYQQEECCYCDGGCYTANGCTLLQISRIHELYLWQYFFKSGGRDFGVMMKAAPSKAQTEFIVNNLKNEDVENNNEGSVSLIVGLQTETNLFCE